jgi:hypothetical protein
MLLPVLLTITEGLLVRRGCFQVVLGHVYSR